ncbi:host-nuclease inhibitor Gam family protein [Leptospira sp. 201903070]|uniref:Host-nuclease inhibitor Gam family protein n=1 Tax=Leptospira ainlahdjerensis TaxID=2810033 RepID=A0ABS2UBZ3_9LEPT|nr:host-nuclease inhibitor Gam family protein [Leptospira ainlahdjerensis]MBM9577468.1 host-nuclease inhibitor Gam family protein [Leptospira ainlahdjerensis]
MSKSKKTINKNSILDSRDNNFKDRTELSQAIQLLGEIKRERDRIKSKVDDRISRLQLDLQKKISPLDIKIQSIASGIKYFVERHKEELFPNSDYKTCKLSTGVLKLRKTPASVKTKGTLKFFERILSENGLLEKFDTLIFKLSGLYLRVKLELNREQILAEPLKAIQKIHVELNEESERLYITPNETEIEIEAVEDAA